MDVRRRPLAAHLASPMLSTSGGSGGLVGSSRGGRHGFGTGCCAEVDVWILPRGTRGCTLLRYSEGLYLVSCLGL